MSVAKHLKLNAHMSSLFFALIMTSGRKVTLDSLKQPKQQQRSMASLQCHVSALEVRNDINFKAY
ncbi:hypothetical protein JCM15764A_28000 [Geotalea toluenoxydans]